jgi:L-alanine-DL-glutamate epimerase-like enolase superfamily enzyme
MIVRAQTLHLRIPLALDFAHQQARFAAAESLLLVVEDEEGRRGIGEAQPRPWVTGETVDEVFGELVTRQHSLLGRTIDELDDVRARVDALAFTMATRSGRNHLATLAAFDTALLDLLGQRRQQTVASLLGWPEHGEFVPVLPVGQVGDETLAKLVKWGRDHHVADAKLRVGSDLGDIVDRVEWLRRELGPLRFGVDANGSWTRETLLSFAPTLVEAGITYVEQPLPVGREAELAELRKQMPAALQISLDESLCTLDEARHVHALGACDLYTLKVGKQGGLLGAGTIADYLLANELPVMISTHVAESAVLEQAGMALARRVATPWNFELGYSTILLRELVVLARPGTPGIGVTLDESALDRWTVRRGVAESSLTLTMNPDDLDSLDMD